MNEYQSFDKSVAACQSRILRIYQFTLNFSYKCDFFLLTLTKSGHWPNELSVLRWSGRPGFNPKLSHTRDSKNGT